MAATADPILPNSRTGVRSLIAAYPPTQGVLTVSDSAVVIGNTAGDDFAITGANLGVKLKAVNDDVWLLFAATGDATAGTATEILLAEDDGWVTFEYQGTWRISCIRATADVDLHIMELPGAATV